MLKVKDGYAKVIGTTYQGSSNYLLLSNGGQKAVGDFATSGSSYTKAESDAKYITNITTAVNKLTFTKNGVNTDRAITVNVVQSQGRRNPLDERNAISGIYTYSTYTKAGLAPSSYFETIGFGQGTSGTIELGGCWTSGGQLYWRALRDCCDNWYDWKTILDNNNYSDILDSRYYTESEVDNLLAKKLDRQNLTNGTWNPREYNLAADYQYSGGDISLSVTGGQMHVSIDGKFWQNEGKYRVLDTSDLPSVGNGTITINQGSTKKGSFTVNQSGNTTITVDANTWRPITDSYSGTNTSTSISQKGANDLYNALNQGPAKRLLVNNEFAKGNNFLQYFNAANMTNPDAIGNAAPDSDWWHIIRMNHENTQGFFSELAIALNSYNGVYWRTIGSGVVKKSWTRLANANEILNPTNYYWANVKVSSTSSTTTSPTVNVLTATRVCAGYDSGVTNAISCSGWFRSSGQTGWYNATYQGGWYMSDTSWIRSHLDKGIYTGGIMKASSLEVFNSNRNVQVAVLDSSNNLVIGQNTTYASPLVTTYLRGSSVNFQVKNGDNNNYTAFQVSASQSQSNNFFSMKAGAEVSGGNFTVYNNAYLAISSGNVGIGTSSPSCKLDVNGTFNVDNTSTFQDGATFYDSINANLDISLDGAFYVKSNNIWWTQPMLYCIAYITDNSVAYTNNSNFITYIVNNSSSQQYIINFKYNINIAVLIQPIYGPYGGITKILNLAYHSEGISFNYAKDTDSGYDVHNEFQIFIFKY